MASFPYPDGPVGSAGGQRVERRWVRRLIRAPGYFLLGALAVGVGLGCAFSSPRYTGPTTDHFDGDKFRNRGDVPKRGFGDFLAWQSSRKAGVWGEPIDPPPGPPPPRRVGDGRLRVTFVNHATALVQLDGLNVLTDPIWSERASPVPFAGPRRVRPPGIRFEDLPVIDVVLLSHNHCDHLDLPTLRRLSAHQPRIFVPLGVAAILARAGIPGAVELDWWQELELAPGVRLTAVPAQHFSNRGLIDASRTLWCGWVVRGPAGAAYFAGDTGYGPHFSEIAARTGPLRAALLPIGAYEPRWFMGPVHLSPEQSVQAAVALKAETSIAIHYGTFRLADDAQHQPVEDLRRALAAHPGVRFLALGFGEGLELPTPARAAGPMDAPGSAVAAPSQSP